MRKIYLLLLTTLFAAVVNGQSMANYAGANFAATSGTFTPLSGGTLVSSVAASDDNISTNLPIGFTFYYMGKAYTQFRAGSDGYISLYTAGSGSSVTNNLATGATVERPVIAPFWDDMDGSASGGVASYLTSGSVGSRVFTFEWLNWARTLGATPVMSFQVKLFESTGVIQFVYRSDAGALSSGSASIGLSAIATGSGNYVSLNNATASATTSTTSETSTISTKPVTGQTYTFTPPQAAVAIPSAGVTFTATTASGMTLNWTDGSTNETNFNVFRSTDNVNFTWVSTVSTTTLATTGTAYTSVQSGLTPGTLYYWQVVANSEGVPSSAVTGNNSTTAAVTYFWVGATGGDWNTAANWNTAADNTGSTRATPSTTDLLIIDGMGTTPGAAGTISVSASQSIGSLQVTSSTAATIQSSAATQRVITLTGAAGDELNIGAGSSILLTNTTNTISLIFSTGTGMTGTIAGTLAVAGTSATASSANSFLTTGGTGTVVTVTSTGVINNTATTNISTNGNVTGSAATLIFSNGSAYNVSGATSGAPWIPLATWGASSTVTISGITTSTTTASNNVQTFGNFTYNCPAATATMSFWGSTSTAVVQGNLTIQATNTGLFRAVTSGTLSILGNLVLTAGTFQVASSTGIVNVTGNVNVNGGSFDIAQGGASSLRVAGNFIQNAGTIAQTSTTGTLEFNGSSTQTFTLIPGSHGTNVINARVNNATDVNLTSAFAIRNLTISRGNLTGAGTLTYGATGLLTYNSTTGNQTANAIEFPNSGGPASLTINNTSAFPNNTVSIPFSRTVSGTLTMTTGFVNTGANTLTLGTSAAATGTLSYAAGGFTSGSTFNRWWPVTAAFGATITAGATPTATGAGVYPFAIGTSSFVSRNLYLNQNTVATTGGTIAVTYTDVAGTSTVSINDGGYVVTTQSNGSWAVAQSGITGTPTYTMSVSGPNLYTPVNGNSRITLAAAPADGTHQNGSTLPNAQRATMTLANLANTYYIGIASVDVPFVSVATGNWEDGTTWNKNPLVPTATDVAIISNTHVVTVNATASAAAAVTVNSGGTLTVSGSTLAITNTLTNSGTVNTSGGTLNVTGASTTGITNSITTGIFNVSGGTVNLGITDNSFCNRTFTNNGTLTVSSGTLNVYGNIANGSSAVFNQSGGDINIDGNAGGVPANSVGSGTALLQFNQLNSGINLTGGTLTIVDPHANTTSSNSIGMSNATTGAQTSTAAHITRFGNGVSTDAGGNAVGFRVDPWTSNAYLQFGSIVVAGPSGTNRSVTSAYQVGVKGNATINSGGHLNLNDVTFGSLFIGGDLTVNTGGTITTVVSLQTQPVISNTSSSLTLAAATNAQTISGGGTFQNLTASPTANLTSLVINNTHPSGVTLSVPLSVSGTLTLTAGVVNTSSSSILSLGTATTAGTLSGGSSTAYINGPFARTFAASRTATGTYAVSTLFPVGKGSSYLPIHIDPSTNSGGPVIMGGEVFTTNSGTLGAGVLTLASNRWEALVVSGGANFTNSFIRLNDAAVVGTNKIVQSTSAAGAYTGIPAATTFAVGTLTTGSSIPTASYSGYFSYGDVTVCATPADQPTGFLSSNVATTSFTGNFTAAPSTPSHYLVVRYPSGGTVTSPVDFTTYTVGAALGAGTIVANVVAPSTTYNATGLVAGTTYDIYIYSYNNNGCSGPVYYTVSPLTGTVTTCAAVIGAPGTPTSSLITTTSFTATWTASSTGGVDYILDVATDNTFTTFVSGYNGLNVGTGTLSYNVNTGLSASTTYFVRVRAVLVPCVSANSATLTVVTDCLPFSPVYTQNFTTYVPSCWKEQAGYLTLTPSALSGSSSAWTADGWLNSGSTGAAKINLYQTGKRDWLISPSIDLGGLGNYQLEFDLATLDFSATSAAALGSDDSLAVVISTDNGATWSTTNILSVWTAANTPVTATGLHVVLPLTSYTGVVRIGFYGAEGIVDDANDVDVMIDNFAINVQPACPVPGIVSVGSITATSASVSFVSAGSNFIVEYGVPGFVPGTGGTAGAGTIVTGTSSPIVITVSPSSTYDVYVRQVCAGPTYSANSPVTSFSTPCNPVSLPYTQNFDGVTAPAIPVCHTVTNNNGDARLWVTSTSTVGITPASSPNQLSILYNEFQDMNDWFFTPGFNLTGGVAYILKFKYRNDGGTFYEEKLEVKYGNSQNAAAMTTSIADLFVSGLSSYTQATYIITPSSSGVYYIGFWGHSDADMDVLGIDDIEFDVAPLPSCPATFTPVNSGNTCISATATTLSWTAGANATGYDVYFDAGAGPATTLVSSNQAGLTYNAGILAAGQYSWRVESRNVVGTTACSNLTFTVNASPTINITPAGPVNICTPGTQLLSLGATNASSPTYQWQNGGVNISGETGTSYTASATGNYRLVVTDGVTGCTGTSNVVAVTINPLPTVSVSPVAATVCNTSITPLTATASVGYPNIKITEVTLFRTGTGLTASYPAYVTGADLVEISNISASAVDVSGITISDYSSGSATAQHTLVLPPSTTIPGNGVLVVHLGTGTDDPGNLYFNTGGTSDSWLSGSNMGVVLSGGGNIIDAVGLNSGYTFAAGTGVTASDWSGFAPSPGGFAGTIRNAATDSNTGADWVQSNTPSPLQTIGTYNGGYTPTSVSFTYLWSPAAGLYTDAGATIAYTNESLAVVYAKPASTTTYSVQVTSAAGCPATSNNAVITVLPANTLEWTGLVNTDWTNPGNWTCGAIPDVNTNVIIKTAPNYPVINLNVEIRSLTAQPGTSVTVATGFDLKINN